MESAPEPIPSGSPGREHPGRNVRDGPRADEENYRRIERHFDFRPAAILKQFNLRYLPVTTGGSTASWPAYGQWGEWT